MIQQEKALLTNHTYLFPSIIELVKNITKITQASRRRISLRKRGKYGEEVLSRTENSSHGRAAGNHPLSQFCITLEQFLIY
jgi:hypothetical protein